MKKYFAAAALSLFLVGNAYAVTIDDTYVFDNPQIVDFESNNIGWIPTNGVAVDSNTSVRSSGYRSCFGTDAGFWTNGVWNTSGSLGTFVQAWASANLYFEFTTPVSAVSAFLNATPNISGSAAPITITVVNATGWTTETYTVDINTNSQNNTGERWGIQRDQADIYGFFLHGRQTGVNDLTYSYTNPGPSPVPEPATMLLFGSGLAGLIGFRKYKTKK